MVWGGVDVDTASQLSFVHSSESDTKSMGEAVLAAAVALSSAGIDSDVDSLSAACRRGPAFHRLLVSLVKLDEGNRSQQELSGRNFDHDRAARPGLEVYSAAQEAIVELFGTLLGR